MKKYILNVALTAFGFAAILLLLICARGVSQSQTNPIVVGVSNNPAPALAYPGKVKIQGDTNGMSKWLEELPQEAKDDYIREAKKTPTHMQKDYHLASQVEAIISRLKTENNATNLQNVLAFCKSFLERMESLENTLSNGIDIHQWNGGRFAHSVDNSKHEEMSIIFSPFSKENILQSIDVKSQESHTPVLRMQFFPDGKFKLVVINQGSKGIELYPNGNLNRYWNSETGVQIEWNVDGKIVP